MMISLKLDKAISMDATRQYSTMTRTNSMKIMMMELSFQENLNIISIFRKFLERSKKTNKIKT